MFDADDYVPVVNPVRVDYLVPVLNGSAFPLATLLPYYLTTKFILLS